MGKNLLKNMSTKTKIFSVISILVLIACFVTLYLTDFFNVNDKIYTNDDFGIAQYKSSCDKDADGIDDQTDMYESSKSYIDKKPEFKDKYYERGYPDDNYGVSTDVVAFGMLGAGYNIKQLLADDIKQRKKDYNIEKSDINIDFRRIKNIKTYLDKNAKSLTIDLQYVDEWQTGDIVLFKNDAGVVSTKRNREGIPYIMHLPQEKESDYIEDILRKNEEQIIGHYRLS